MSDDSENLISNEDSDTVDLKYEIYADEPSLTVYLKFNGFEDNEQIADFAEFMEEHLPLLLFRSDVMH